MKVKIKKVNDLIVCDEHMRIMIIKKPKRRYRTIVRAFYKRNLSKGQEIKMAKGKAIYFSKKELENLNEFVNHWDDRLSEKDEDFYLYWIEKVGSSFYKIAESLQNRILER